MPWSALAPLRDRPVSVSPSLSAWSTAAQAATGRGAGARRDRPAAFVAGPALQFADAEITELARSYTRAAVVSSAESTADGVVDLFGRCELVHLACHGAFRTDNPLFSTLAVGDGPLTVYDLERAAGMPEVVVLSACSVGTSAAINGGTLLGLSSALGAFGASDVIAPLTPVNDEQVMAVMRRVHERPGGGRGTGCRAGRCGRRRRAARPRRRGVRGDRRLTSATSSVAARIWDLAPRSRHCERADGPHRSTRPTLAGRGGAGALEPRRRGR